MFGWPARVFQRTRCPHCAAVRLNLFRPDPRAILRYSWSRLLHRLTSLMPRRSNNKPPNIPHSSGGHPGGYSWVQRERPVKSSDHQQIKIDVPGLFFVALLVVFVLWPLAQWALGGRRRKRFDRCALHARAPGALRRVPPRRRLRRDRAGLPHEGPPPL